MIYQFLGALVGTGLGLMGNKAQASATLKGTASAIKMEKMQQDFMTKSFEKDLERQDPFIKLGEQGVKAYNYKMGINKPNTGQLLDARLMDRRGFGEGGIAKLKRRLLEDDTEGMSKYAQETTMGGMEAGESEANMGRLMDLQKIGLGAAGTAGQSSQALGQTVASSQMRAGNLGAMGAQYGQGARQDMWLQTADAISGLPALFASQRSNQSGGNNNNNNLSYLRQPTAGYGR